MDDNNAVGSSQSLSSCSSQKKETTGGRKDLAEAFPDVATDESALSLTGIPRNKLREENPSPFPASDIQQDELHKEHVTEGFEPGTWDDPLICEFEELLSDLLFVTFQGAVKDLAQYGYDKDTAELIILRSGFCHGRGDVMSNIVAGANAMLKSKNEFDLLDRSKPCIFENLRSLVKFTVLEMTCVLRELMPSLTVVEALWSLLQCDMSLFDAWVLQLRRYEFFSRPRPPSGSGKGCCPCPFCKINSQRALQKGTAEKKSRGNKKGTSKRNMLREKHMSKGASKAKSNVGVDTESMNQVNIPSSSGTPHYLAGIPYDKSAGKYVAADEKDEMILVLISHVRALQLKLESWIESGTQKIQIAALSLNNYRFEVNCLRKEKEEEEKIGKQNAENSMKRLSDMEHELSNVIKQIPEKNIANNELRQANEAAKMNARDCRKRLLEARLREQRAQENVESCDMEKTLMQEEFTALKHDAATVESQLKIAKGRLQQSEALRKHEETEKVKILSKLKSIKSDREQQEALAKSKGDDLIQKSEGKMHKHREEMKKLVKEISLLKFESQSSKLAAYPTWIEEEIGIDPTNVGLQLPKPPNRRLEVFRDIFGAGRMKPERECVMCLMEERSIVFLPCAHQVLCTACNEVHKEQGINDCPTCRTSIQMRIQVRFAYP